MATTCRCHLQIRLFDLLIFAKFRVAHFAKINHTANLEKGECLNKKRIYSRNLA